MLDVCVMKIIINADDFGYSESVNRAIAESFAKGYITNTTVMTNMPGFEDSIALAKEEGFFDKVGLHLNFFEGDALTDQIKEETLFSIDGQLSSYNIFHNSGMIKRFFLPKHTACALREETAAQIEKYRHAGFPQYHLDSHGHSHTIISVYMAIRSLIKKNKFRTIRKSLNLSPKRSFVMKCYKKLCNRLILGNRKSTKYFTSASEFIECVKAGMVEEDAVCEIMVHPVYEDGKLVNAGDVDFETLLPYLDKKTLISYSEI